GWSSPPAQTPACRRSVTYTFCPPRPSDSHRSSYHRVKFADLKTNPTLDALLLVQPVRLLQISADPAPRAELDAGLTTRALLGKNLVFNERFADPRRASLVPDVGNVLVLKILDRSEQWIGCASAQGAERAVLDCISQINQLLQISFPALSLAHAIEDAQDLSHAFPARSAFSTAFIQEKIQEVS